MHGFPKHIATKQDYENLLSMNEYKEEAIKKLEELQDFDDRIVTRATDKLIDPNNPESDFIVEEIPNPYPQHAQKGFKVWEDVVGLNARNTRGKLTIEARKREILSKYTKEEIEGVKVEVRK